LHLIAGGAYGLPEQTGSQGRAQPFGGLVHTIWGSATPLLVKNDDDAHFTSLEGGCTFSFGMKAY